MPRNPHKTPCQVPGCRNWAMRGHTRCRPHRDAELGPRGAGAPSGNLNALKHGCHTHPLPPPDLQCLAAQILETPADLPFHLGRVTQSLQDRVGDPFLLLVALHRLLAELIPHVAERLFTAELEALLHDLPPAARREVWAAITPHLASLGPVTRLRWLRERKKSGKNNYRNREPL